MSSWLIVVFVKLGAACWMELWQSFILLSLPANRVPGNANGEKSPLYSLPVAA